MYRLLLKALDPIDIYKIQTHRIIMGPQFRSNVFHIPLRYILAKK
jgi:hypothetical protein